MIIILSLSFYVKRAYIYTFYKTPSEQKDYVINTKDYSSEEEMYNKVNAIMYKITQEYVNCLSYEYFVESIPIISTKNYKKSMTLLIFMNNTI